MYFLVEGHSATYDMLLPKKLNVDQVSLDQTTNY